MQSTVESVEGNKVKLHVTVPADEFEHGDRRRVPQARTRGADPRLPSGQGAAAAARGAPRHRHGARAGAARRAARVLRRCRHRARRRRHRAARDRDHRGRGRRRRRVRRGRRGAPAGAARRATTSCASSCRSEAVDDDASTSRSTACANASPTSTDSDPPLIDDDYADDRHHGYDRRRAGRGSHRHRLPLPRSDPGWSSPELDAAAARHAARRDPRVQRDAARTLRRARRRRSRASACS